MCLVMRFCSDFSSFAIFSFLRFLFSYGQFWPKMAILSGILTLRVKGLNGVVTKKGGAGGARANINDYKGAV